MEEKAFYGLWNEKNSHWEHFNGILFTEYLQVVLGVFYNIKQEYEAKNWPHLSD